MKTKSKIAVITGAASGMGRGTSIFFAEKDYTVVCTDINESLLNETVTRIIQKGGKAFAIPADITKVDDINNLVEEIRKKFNRIDILINFAGLLGGIKELVDFNEKEMDLILDVNLKGTYRCCKYFLPLMIERKSGIIINISSQSGKISSPYISIYNAAKWGVIGFSKSLELEVKKYGIKVAVINPGGTHTEFRYSCGDSRFDTNFMEKNFLKPIDIARICLFIVEQPEHCLIKELDVIPMTEIVQVIQKDEKI